MRLSNIIYLEEFRSKKNLKKCKKNRQFSHLSYDDINYENATSKKYLHHQIQVKQKIDDELNKNQFLFEKEQLYKNLDTKKPKFKYPTILSQYRKNINPISAIYESFQKSIMKYDERNDVDIWVLDLVKFNIDYIMESLQNDIQYMHEFIQQYNHRLDYFDDLQLIYNQMKLFSHYIKVFSIIKSWD